NAKLSIPNKIKYPFLLRPLPGVEKLLHIPRTVSRETEIRILFDESRGLFQRDGLSFCNLALEIGVADVDMAMRNNKDRPLSLRSERKMERPASGRRDIQRSDTCSFPFGNLVLESQVTETRLALE